MGRKGKRLETRKGGMGKESINANGGVGKRGDEGRKQRSKDSVC